MTIKKTQSIIKTAMNKMLHTKALVEKQNVSENGVIDAVVGSSAVLDRMGDIISQDGWNLKNFLANPVILWAHNGGLGEDRPPIGKAVKVWVENKGKKNAKLMFKVQMDLQDSFAAEIFRKIKEGFINTVSVGFMPIEWEELDPDNWFGGLKYTEQELLELSFVPVPANPEALVQLNSFSQTDKRFTPIAEKDLFMPEKDNRDKKMWKESSPISDEKATTENEKEYRTILRDVSEFEEGAFRAMPMTKDGKEYVVVVGKLKGTSQYIEQSFNYAKDTWTQEEVDTHKKLFDTPTDGPAVEDTSTPEDTVEETPEAQTAPEPAVEETLTEETEEVVEEAQAEEVVEEIDEDAPEVQTPEEVKQLDVMLGLIAKSGRVLSSKNESRVRQAMELLDSVLTELDKEDIVEEDTENPAETEIETKEVEEKVIDKGVIPYKDLGTLPESENWDGPGEVAKAEIADLKVMCTWFDADNAEAKASYKLPHHKADGDHPAIWRGVAAAMASLLGARGGIDIPEADRKGVYNHLIKHYKEFNKDEPEFKMVEDQVLAGFEEEIQALTLDREEKHVVRLIKKVLENQKTNKKIVEPQLTEVSSEQAIKALEVISLALSKVDLKKGA